MPMFDGPPLAFYAGSNIWLLNQLVTHNLGEMANEEPKSVTGQDLKA